MHSVEGIEYRIGSIENWIKFHSFILYHAWVLWSKWVIGWKEFTSIFRTYTYKWLFSFSLSFHAWFHFIGIRNLKISCRKAFINSKCRCDGNWLNFPFHFSTAPFSFFFSESKSICRFRSHFCLLWEGSSPPERRWGWVEWWWWWWVGLTGTLIQTRTNKSCWREEKSNYFWVEFDIIQFSFWTSTLFRYRQPPVIKKQPETPRKLIKTSQKEKIK